ncbi:MAG: AAA domain-containing protein [Pseudomonadales bacterium]|nr:AAA domain-containing protein [Pseudomonadales bacterium]
MPSLSEIIAWTRSSFDNVSIGLIYCLISWIKEHPASLQKIIRPKILDLREILNTLLLVEIDEEDTKFIQDIICQKGDASGVDLISILASSPTNRVHRLFEEHGVNWEKTRNCIAKDKHEKEFDYAGQFARESRNVSKLLSSISRDLTLEAELGEFDHLLPRDNELKPIVRSLARARKPNVITIGEAGIGKTSIIELLARECVKNANHILAGYEIFEIAIGELVAGTRYRGDFEEKFYDVINGLKERKNTILFIDEFHLLYSAGNAQNIDTNAGNLIKPLLTGNNIRVIGATTNSEYQQSIAKDPALARRFELVKLSPPCPTEVRKMVERQSSSLAKSHKIKIEENVYREAINLADRYLPNRNQPDKSIDLLDSACVTVREKGRSKKMELFHLQETLSQMSSIPLNLINGVSEESSSEIESTINRRIIDQKEAVRKSVDVILHYQQDLGSPNRPRGVLMFAGSSGVGKTEMAKAIAEDVLQDANALLHLSMEEYADKASLNKLLGSPSGYTGSDVDGTLIQKLRDCPIPVLLLDEIEKAAPEVQQALLGMCGEGRICSGIGQSYNVRNSIVIFTTNALSKSAMNKKPIGFQSMDKPLSAVELLSGSFSKEFLGRMDEVIVFNELSPSSIKEVLKLRLDEYVRQLKAHRILIQYDEQRLLDHILSNFQLVGFGARAVEGVLRQALKYPISSLVSLRKRKKNLNVLVDDEFYSNGKLRIVVDKVKSGALPA